LRRSKNGSIEEARLSTAEDLERRRKGEKTVVRERFIFYDGQTSSRQT
jgi:hypothetical protein